jgi:hypothetical protein
VALVVSRACAGASHPRSRYFTHELVWSGADAR